MSCCCSVVIDSKLNYFHISQWNTWSIYFHSKLLCIYFELKGWIATFFQCSHNKYLTFNIDIAFTSQLSTIMTYGFFQVSISLPTIYTENHFQNGNLPIACCYLPLMDILWVCGGILQSNWRLCSLFLIPEYVLLIVEML